MGRPLSSVAGLQKRVAFLEDVNEQQALAISAKDTALGELRAEVITLRRKRQECSDECVKTYGRLNEMTRERDAMRQQVDMNLERAQRAEAALKEAQALAELMRRQAFPDGPQFPWETDFTTVAAPLTWPDGSRMV